MGGRQPFIMNIPWVPARRPAFRAGRDGARPRTVSGMTDQSSEPDGPGISLERAYPAPPDRIWQLWTTSDGIEAWWSPDGFSTEVGQLDLRPGGELVHTMTARDPQMVQFMTDNGMPLANTSRKRFTEVDPPRRIGYDSLVDYVPGVPPYWVTTMVDLVPEDGGTRVIMTAQVMHDEEWTQRLIMGRQNELENLAKLVS